MNKSIEMNKPKQVILNNNIFFVHEFKINYKLGDLVVVKTDDRIKNGSTGKNYTHFHATIIGVNDDDTYTVQYTEGRYNYEKNKKKDNINYDIEESVRHNDISFKKGCHLYKGRIVDNPALSKKGI